MPPLLRRLTGRTGWATALAATIVAAGLLPVAPGLGRRPADPPTMAFVPGAVPRAERRVGEPEPSSTTAATEPQPLVDPGLGLREGPIDVPIALDLPSIGVHADVLGVGLGTADIMDAPTGGDEDPVWGQAFWYRGSAVPGVASTALIAGHIGSRYGPGVFARLDELVPGDPIVVQDLRTGLGTRFVVTETAEYTLEESGRPDVLERTYGTGPVAGTHPQPSIDGLAHLTLITCAGTFRGDTHDRRRVVSAVAGP